MIIYGEVRDLWSGVSVEDSDPAQALDFVCGTYHGGSLSGGAKLFNGATIQRAGRIRITRSARYA